MIKPGEIQKVAYTQGVRDLQIEKDYILSWILLGISQHDSLSRVLAFKGGTALKKVYFGDYRFSEDLDFTILDEGITEEQIETCFHEVFAIIKSETNIPLDITGLPEKSNAGLSFFIKYVGPLGGIGAQKSIKIDISRGERLVFEPLLMPALVKYSDLVPHHLLCYSLPEILIEKLRSIIQRMQPRDLFDIWFLLEINQMDVSHYYIAFNEKCNISGINALTFLEKLEKRMPLYKARWQNSLKSQMKDLPDFEKVEREVFRHFRGFR